MDHKIVRRLQQLYDAIEGVCDNDVSEVRPLMTVVNGRVVVSVDMRQGKSDAELANALQTLVTNIACLKDYLKAWCKQHGVQFAGDKLIASDLDVAIIHDLWILDKHAEPHNSRSGRWPRLGEIERCMRISTGGRAGSFAGMTLDSATGELRQIGDGSSQLVIDAQVVDKAGAPLGSLLEIAERAVGAWERVLVTAGVTIPPP